ncbi:MAG: class II D-tagatose-bisphosphate aldolase, non-catalytic subunit, partial [Erysipelothrix sp.]|nr:class II D-tagatose-bisphosphate aldolase, non-catalytic subunit [Erysipelothrix sp.]
LLSNLNNVDLPMNLISQFLPVQYRKVNEGKLEKTAEALISDVIGVTLDDYFFAIKR